MRHPLVVEAELRIVAIRSEIARILVTIDERLAVTRPYLLALYEASVGRWELLTLEAQLRFLRARRLLEAAQAAMAKHEPFDKDLAEEALDRELASWQDDIARKTQAVADASWAKASADPEFQERYRQAREIYRRLVLRLHPDLIGEPTEAQKRLLLRAHEAYQAGEVEELADIEALIGAPPDIVEEASVLERLEAREGKLRAQLDKQLARLADLDKELPFPLADKLHDPTYVDARVHEEQVAAAAFDRRTAEVEDLLAAVLLARRSAHGGPPRPD